MKDAFLLPEDRKWEILEAVFSVPVEQRDALLRKLLKDNKEAYLGSTNLTAPEIATELIKKGIKAKSFVKGKAKKAA